MINFGEVPSGAVLPIPFDTFDGGTGASITLTGLAITDVEVYKGASMTQRASDAGVVLMDTDGIDLDGTTGIHGFSVDTGDNTDAGFYAVGSYFWIVVSAVTIDAQTVNFVAATFRLKAAESVAGKPKVDVDTWRGTAAPAEHTAGYPIVTLKDGAGTGEINTNGGKVVGVELVDVVTTHTGNTPQTGDNFARLGAPAGASHAADLLVIDNLVDELESRLSAARAAYIDNLSAGAAALEATAQSVKTKTDALPSDPADASVVAGLIAALNNISEAQVLAQVAAALTATIADSIPADGTRPSIASGIYILTQFMLERAVSGTTVTVKKPDGSTTLFTLTISDATTPASITRAT